MDNQTLIIKLIALSDAPHMTEDEKSAAMLIAMHRHDALITRQARLEGKKEAINFVKQKLFYENGKLASFAQYEAEIEAELASSASEADNSAGNAGQEKEG